jgi:D-sedoheptulose 7-phosphate isomerase
MRLRSYGSLNYDPRAVLPSRPRHLASMLEPRIQQHFFESADLSYQAAETMARPIADAAQAIVDCVTAGGRVWVHGRGVAQAPAQLLGAALSGRFERDRPGLAAMVLAVDPLLLSEARASVEDAPAVTQLRVLGQAGDVLVAFATRPDDALLAAVVGAAHEREMSALVIAGREPSGAATRAPGQGITAETDIWITVPHERPARICELQLLTLHALCDAVDLQLLGDADL